MILRMVSSAQVSPRAPGPLAWLLLGAVTVAGLVGCGAKPAEGSAGSAAPSSSEATAAPAEVPDKDGEFLACDAAYQEIVQQPAAPGAPAFDAHRPEFLGRVRGSPVIFVETPKQTPLPSPTAVEKATLAAFEKGAPEYRVIILKDALKNDKPALRSVLLRQGYLFSENPSDLFNEIEQVSLVALFDAPTLFLKRGQTISELHRVAATPLREAGYQFSDSTHTAVLLFGDRVAESRAELENPLDRDLLPMQDQEGFDRLKIDHLTTGSIAVSLRYASPKLGTVWAKGVVDSQGSATHLRCLAEPRSVREEVAKRLGETAEKRAALAKLREAVTAGVDDAFPFDRPRGVTGPDRDGELRPYWTAAYLRGSGSFTDDKDGYAVFKPDGTPWVPEVCVDFVLDSFERASGNWYAPRGQKPGRTPGKLSWDSYHPQNKRGVIGFGQFAETSPNIFETRKFEGKERIPFGDRAGFFKFLTDHVDLFEAGDILSIQGLKRDDRVHQHAILLDRTDPITGFAYGLADQMRLPRRRSWEGIMAEAPKRSLYYRARPTAEIWSKLGPEAK